MTTVHPYQNYYQPNTTNIPVTNGGTVTVHPITVGGGYVGYGTQWGSVNTIQAVAPTYYDEYATLSRNISLEYIQKLIEEKNIISLINMADLTLKKDRRTFLKLEKTIVDTKNFELIGQYMSTVKNFSVRHLTKPFLESYRLSEDKSQNRFLFSAFQNHNKIDIRMCINFAKKYNDSAYIDWFMYSSYYSDIDQDIENNNLTQKHIHQMMDLCTNTAFLVNLANVCKLASKEKIFKRIRHLGDLESAQQILNRCDEDWAVKLRHLR